MDGRKVPQAPGTWAWPRQGARRARVNPLTRRTGGPSPSAARFLFSRFMRSRWFSPSLRPHSRRHQSFAWPTRRSCMIASGVTGMAAVLRVRVFRMPDTIGNLTRAVLVMMTGCQISENQSGISIWNPQPHRRTLVRRYTCRGASGAYPVGTGAQMVRCSEPAALIGSPQ